MEMLLYFDSKVSRPDKLAVHVFEVDEDVDKDEVSLHVGPLQTFSWFHIPKTSF